MDDKSKIGKSLKSQYVFGSETQKRKIVEIVASNILLNERSVGFNWRNPWNLLPKKGENEKWSTLIPQTRSFFLRNPFLELNVLKGFSSRPDDFGGKK